MADIVYRIYDNQTKTFAYRYGDHSTDCSLRFEETPNTNRIWQTLNYRNIIPLMVAYGNGTYERPYVDVNLLSDRYTILKIDLDTNEETEVKMNIMFMDEIDVSLSYKFEGREGGGIYILNPGINSSLTKEKIIKQMEDDIKYVFATKNNPYYFYTYFKYGKIIEKDGKKWFQIESKGDTHTFSYPRMVRT